MGMCVCKCTLYLLPKTSADGLRTRPFPQQNKGANHPWRSTTATDASDLETSISIIYYMIVVVKTNDSHAHSMVRRSAI